MTKELRRTIKLFISHNSSDAIFINKLSRQLEQNGFDVQTYEAKLRYSNHIDPWVKDQISTCDYFFLILTQNARDSTWVQRELGLALTLQSQSEGFRPQIILFEPANAEAQTGQPPSRAPIVPLNYDYPKIQLEPFETASRRIFCEVSPHVDSFEVLISQMTPKVLFVREDIRSSEQLDQLKFFKLYESLFKESERDPRQKMLVWLFEKDTGDRRHISIARHNRWRTLWLRKSIIIKYRQFSILAVLSLNDRTIGLCFLTYHPESRILFGNYFGIEKHWRSFGTAGLFADKLRAALSDKLEGCTGLCFEIEPVDFARVESIVSRVEETKEKHLGDEGDDSDTEIIRRFLRLIWYCRKGAEIFSDSDGNALYYRQPCLEIEKKPSDWPKNEEELWLLLMPIGSDIRRSNIRRLFNEMLYVVLLKIIGESNAVDRPAVGSRYLQYVGSIVKDIRKRNAGKTHELRNLIKDRHSKLAARWFDLNIEIKL